MHLFTIIRILYPLLAFCQPTMFSWLSSLFVEPILPPSMLQLHSWPSRLKYHLALRPIPPPIQWVEASWNVMAHVQKPDFVFRWNGRVNLNRRGRQFSRILVSRGVSISGSNAGYTMFWGSVKSTGYPLHLPVSPSLPLQRVTVCHHISTGLY